MKGKIEVRFLAPNTGRVRTRLEKVSDDFTQKLRAAIQEAAAQTIESHQVSFRALVAQKVSEMEAAGEIKFSGSHKDAVLNVTNDFFAIYCESTKEAFEERFPAEKAEEAEEPAKELVEAPKPEAKPEAKAPAKGKPALDEFDD